jgi:diacylglycerol kinase (ATP)
MPDFLQSRLRAFRYAFSGWWYVIRSQRNAWIHALVSLLVVLVSAWVGLTAENWALVILAMALVWTAEFLNTALEAVVDLASPSENHLAKVGKDVGAASVLIASLSAAIIGIMIIGPPLWERLSTYFTH